MRISRAVATAAALLVTALTATGCVAVHGSTTPVEALDRHEAGKVLHDYEVQNNQAYANRDLPLNARVETGSLGALDQAGLKILSFTDPRGNLGKAPIKHERPEFLIPKVIGWPKWFAVHSTPNFNNAKPQLLVFVKANPDAVWQAAWGPTLQSPLPELRRDADGYLEPVAPNAAGLAAAPGELAPALTEFLKDGKTRAELFGPDPYTAQLRKQREEPIGEGFVRQTVDGAANQFPPLALRTKDGGALVLFALQHSVKLTVQPPRRLGDVDPSTLTFLTGKPTRAVTEHRLSEYVAVVPKAGGKVQLVGWMYGLVGADGE
ncbi:hypothetical protein OG948_25965 [Embleya sp. NBC_00888]|uniref:hypothetical protein n=1 Tax=Embleya sp. NBC_00888 TaxID=2975960 RepID=UPI00386C95B9|nr:hypothetical protein OG948_25965 [Embleya sp. NBC_00888]